MILKVTVVILILVKKVTHLVFVLKQISLAKKACQLISMYLKFFSFYQYRRYLLCL